MTALLPVRRLWWTGWMLWLLLGAAWAEQEVVHQGRTRLSFDIPGLTLAGRVDRKTSILTFVKKVGDGNLQVNVNIRSWIARELDNEFRKDRDHHRRDVDSRVGADVEIQGAARTLTYRTSSPFDGWGLIVYTDTLRAEFVVTGSRAAADQAQPTFELLVKTLKIR